MKRWLLAVAVLLCGTLSVAYADYVILIYNLGQSKGETADGGTGPRGPAAPGGGLSQLTPGAGAGGAARGPGAGLGAAGGGGLRGPIAPGRGAAGGGFPGGGGAYGGPQQQRPPAGALGGPMMPGMGAGGGAGRGGMSPEGFFGGGMSSGSGSSEAEGTPLYVKTVVEVKVTRPQAKLINNGKKGWVTTPYGATCLMDTNSNFVAAVVHHDTVMQAYDRKKRAVEQETDSTAKLKDLLDLENWTLTHGLIQQFEATMKDIEALDPQNAAVVAFKQIDAEIKKPVQGTDLSGMWKEKLLQNYETTTSEHYVLLHQSKSAPVVVKSRLNRLENHFKMFYYWFALAERGSQILPVPQQRLVAVLVPDRDEFERQQKIFEATHLVDDGFFARRENLVVFSQQRIDEGYVALLEHDKPIWQGGTFDRADSLKGKIPKKLSRMEDAEDKLCEAHTMALLEKALEDDAERAAVTHDGTRQLVGAAGLTTPGVVAPEWIQFGLASFLETPKGAPWTSAAYGHWEYRDAFRKLVGDKKKDNPLDVLKGVITDRYFRLAANHKAKPEDNLEMKARATAWGLAYYLARNHLDGLLRYYKELRKLPRDMEFDDEVLLGCFTRAFDLVDPSGKKIDENKLAEFANIWHATINNRTPNEAEDFIKELQKDRADAMKDKPQGKSSPFRPPAGGGGGDAP